MQPNRITEVGIKRATLEAMKLAVVQLFVEHQDLLGDGITAVILVDGVDLIPLGPGFTQRAIIRGDAKSLSIAAASIIAKVARDDLMFRAGLDFPEYGWGANSGYGTRRHVRAIKNFGLCPLHRRTFCEQWLPE